MVFTNHSQNEPPSELCIFIIKELGITKEALELGIRQARIENAPLPIVLKCFGLITMDQYEKILNWQSEN
tara:strand:+ start:385 stop:594 length:210 start_codon:yes stop_codon:yes gene_type:complete